MSKNIDVVAALIRKDGKFLICRRPENKSRALLWEFPGGKVETGETKEEALIRECVEELDITVKVGEAFSELIHEYTDITIRLTVFNAAVSEGEPKLIEHVDLRWITPYEIPYYDFCPADEKILDRIISEGK